MLLLYYIISFVLDPLMFFFRSYDPVIMTVICDIILILVLSSKRKIKEIENKNKKEIKNN